MSFLTFTRLPDGRRAFVHEDRANGPLAVVVRLSDGTEARFADQGLAALYIHRLEAEASKPFKKKSGG